MKEQFLSSVFLLVTAICAQSLSPPALASTESNSSLIHQPSQQPQPAAERVISARSQPVLTLIYENGRDYEPPPDIGGPVRSGGNGGRLFHY